jgi:hypothetical protein
MDANVKAIYLYQLYTTEFPLYSSLHHEALWYRYLDAIKEMELSEYQVKDDISPDDAQT